VKKAKKGKRTARKWPRLGSLAVGAIVAAVAGFIVLIVVNGMTGGDDASDFVPAITETRSESGDGPFQGGARLYFPVNSIDMGKVPLNEHVGYTFAMTNLGDAPAEIQDVNVTAVEGC
jgi:hypothetical protein